MTREGADPAVVAVVVERGGQATADVLAVEEPLEIRVDGRPLAVVMRTPGDDLDLAAGFLRTEGVIDGIDDLSGLDHCRETRENAGNVVLAVLASGVRAAPERFERARREMYAASSCGLCGKATIERVFQQAQPLRARLDTLDAALVVDLPERLRAAQARFALTGGLHGAGLFTADGALLVAREDVGRHNAVDKVIGARLRADLPVEEGVLVVSGRAGFEIVQKALMAGISAIVAVGAASSLADRLAREAGMALYSFVRPGGYNRHR